MERCTLVLMHAENNTPEGFQHDDLLAVPLVMPINRAFRSLLQTTIAAMHSHFQNYRAFDLMAQTIYEFVWNEYCDWYLELSKPILLSSKADRSQQPQETCVNLIEVLEICLRLLHPLMPFITEEIWQAIAPLAGKKDDVMMMLHAYPRVVEARRDNVAEQSLVWIKKIVSTLRTLRSRNAYFTREKIPLLPYKGNEEDRENSRLFQEEISNLAKLSTMHWIDEKDGSGRNGRWA